MQPPITMLLALLVLGCGARTELDQRPDRRARDASVPTDASGPRDAGLVLPDAGLDAAPPLPDAAPPLPDAGPACVPAERTTVVADGISGRGTRWLDMLVHDGELVVMWAVEVSRLRISEVRVARVSIDGELLASHLVDEVHLLRSARMHVVRGELHLVLRDAERMWTQRLDAEGAATVCCAPPDARIRLSKSA